MSKTNGVAPEAVEMVEEEARENILFTNFRKLMLAGFGVATVVQEKVGELQETTFSTFDKLVEKGETFETKTRENVSSTVDTRKKQLENKEVKLGLFGYNVKLTPVNLPVVETPEGKLDTDARIEEMLAKLNLPTQKDVKSLTSKLNTLNKKVDELKKQQAVEA